MNNICTKYRPDNSNDDEQLNAYIDYGSGCTDTSL